MLTLQEMRVLQHKQAWQGVWANACSVNWAALNMKFAHFKMTRKVFEHRNSLAMKVHIPFSAPCSHRKPDGSGQMNAAVRRNSVTADE